MEKNIFKKILKIIFSITKLKLTRKIWKHCLSFTLEKYLSNPKSTFLWLFLLSFITKIKPSRNNSFSSDESIFQVNDSFLAFTFSSGTSVSCKSSASYRWLVLIIAYYRWLSLISAGYCSLISAGYRSLPLTSTTWEPCINYMVIYMFDFLTQSRVKESLILIYICYRGKHLVWMRVWLQLIKKIAQFDSLIWQPIDFM